MVNSPVMTGFVTDGPEIGTHYVVNGPMMTGLGSCTMPQITNHRVDS